MVIDPRQRLDSFRRSSLLVVGDDQLELEYSREVRLSGRDRAIEYLSLELAQAPPGEYEIRLRVYDAGTEANPERRRRFVVLKE